MKLAPPGLTRALDAGLKPLYVILGEEPCAAQEAADRVRAAARAAGYDERVLLFVESGFNWDDLHAEAASGGSLFGNKRLIEVKIANGRIDAAGQAAVAEFAADPPPDTLLLVVVLGADYRTFKSAAARKLAEVGIVIECRPLGADELVRWVKMRLTARGLDVPEAGVALITESAQGNLLAAAQAVERLGLLAEAGPIALETVRAAAVDEARYGLFDLADAALAGETETALRILVRLRETGTAPAQVLWALARDVRLLAGLAWAREHGATPPRIWPPARTQ
ncbi:MAG: DNA polymerase III subunit delta, partial [Gammaproteobacteria bacterium]